MLVIYVPFLSSEISYAGIEEVLMPEAIVFIKGKLPSDCTIN
jgi:hypothetical protein